jgi:hypothetical protein
VTQAPRPTRYGGILQCGHWAEVIPGKREHNPLLRITASMMDFCGQCHRLQPIVRCNVPEPPQPTHWSPVRFASGDAGAHGSSRGEVGHDCP